MAHGSEPLAPAELRDHASCSWTPGRGCAHCAHDAPRGRRLCAGTASQRRAGSTLTVAVVVPSGIASATSGSGSVSSAHRPDRHWTPARVRCRPRRVAGAAAAGQGGPARPAGSRRTAVRRIRVGGDVEAVAEVAQVRKEELCGRARAELGAVDMGADAVRLVSAQCADQGPYALTQVGGVLAAVAGAGIGLESDADRLERIQGALRRANEQRVERPSGAEGRRAQRARAVGRDAQRAGDVVGPPAGMIASSGSVVSGTFAAAWSDPSPPTSATRYPHPAAARKQSHSSRSVEVTAEVAQPPSSSTTATRSRPVCSGSATPLACALTTTSSSWALLPSATSPP